MKKIKLLAVLSALCMCIFIFTACDLQSLVGGAVSGRDEPDETKKEEVTNWWNLLESFSDSDAIYEVETNKDYFGNVNGSTEESHIHTVAVLEAIAPTCTETGLGEGSYCSECGEKLAEQEIISAIGHDWVVLEAVAPTCTETGLSEGSYCSECGEKLAEQEIISAIGHDWNDELVCNNCNESITPTEGLAYDLINDGTEYVIYDIGDTKLKEIVIPSEYNGKPVTMIDSRAFEGYDITTVVIPSSIREIGEYAFANCYNLENVYIAEGVETVGRYAFNCCYNLKSITLPGSLKNPGEYMLADCSSLESVTMNEGFEVIPGYMLAWCSSLKSISVPSTLKTVDSNAFTSYDNINFNEYSNAYYLGNEENPYHILMKAKNTKIRSCDIHTDTEIIAGNAFYDCYSLKLINIPENVKSIGTYAFYSCTSLASAYLPEGLEYIGEYAFNNCSALTSINIPNSVETIEYSSLGNTWALESITVPFIGRTMNDDTYNFFTYIFGAANSTDQYYYNSYISSDLKTIVVNGGENLAFNAFYNCGNVISITLPEGVKNIGEYAFYGCNSLTSLTLPESLESIGKNAFYECSALERIDYAGTQSQWSGVKKDEGWDGYSSFYGVYCSDGEVFMTFEEACAKEYGQMVSVKGAVRFIERPWIDYNGNMAVVITDDNGNRILVNNVTEELKIGNVITVKGYIDHYNDIDVIYDPQVEVVDKVAFVTIYQPTTIAEIGNKDCFEFVSFTGYVNYISSSWDENNEFMSVEIYDSDTGHYVYVNYLNTQVQYGDIVTVYGFKNRDGGISGATATILGNINNEQ